MKLGEAITGFSLAHYKLVTIVMVLFTLVLGAMIPLIKVDTDPENMLPADEPVRVFHNMNKERFALSDIVVVGIVNNKHPEGVFNAESLNRIYELTEFARTLRCPDENDPAKEIGVVEVDILSPSTVDHIAQGGPGEVKFEWLMNRPPADDANALEIRTKALANPLLKNTVVSEDGRAVCIYLPLTSKDLSYRVYSALKTKLAEFKGPEEYHITGLPVAEDTFGVEMFIQMAVSAPLAMLVIFLLLLLFFRRLVLVISPMIVAMVSVISTMGLLIGFGYPVHIMSSMIPIFLMPIAVVDSVHILSEFFGLYTPEKGRKATIKEVMVNLFTPMLYTSLTSAAGFASLALTPIPPVQVFGIFVAIGIMIAWVFTVTFVPAYVMFIKDSSLSNFGRHALHAEKPTQLAKLLRAAGGFTYKKAKPILAVLTIVVIVAGYGITRIRINDNPVKWFSKSHPIRQADIELNRHFGGTYMAYLVLETPQTEDENVIDFAAALGGRFSAKVADMAADYPKVPFAKMEKLITEESTAFSKTNDFLDRLSTLAGQEAKSATDDDTADAWLEIADFFDLEKERSKIFKQPAVLEYMVRLQDSLVRSGVIGKSNSVADIVRKVHKELTDGTEQNYRIPDSSAAVAQCLLQFQSSHRPADLWHFIDYEYSAANIWIQLTSGDNKDMEQTIAAVDKFFAAHPPPVPLVHKWAGLTYINTVWQNKMVWGMLQSFLGSFLIVFIMMAILFRSPLWGIICMIPLTITILVIYGIIGFVGKDYDMPVAVLSALTLGMAVDFAIHFLERARDTYNKTGSWQTASPEMFGEPALAISRNVLVIAIGFLPLLAAPLVPYKTVGIFLCAIMALSGIVTLLVLPSVLRIGEKLLFKTTKAPVSGGCNCSLCLTVSIASVGLIALNLHQNWQVGPARLAIFSAVAIPIMALICGIISRRKACKKTVSAQLEV